jgi:hypothetical protein
MKKIILILMMLSLVVGVNGATWESQVLGPDVVLESLTFSPYPVEPGGTFDLTIKVHNTNSQRTIESPRFTIQEASPFTLETDPKVKILNSLVPNEEALVNFRIKVSEGAFTGVNDLVIVYQEATRATYLSDPIKVDVKSSGIELSVASIETVPEEIFPGDEAQIKLKLTNTLPVLMKNIDLKLDLSDASVPFIPLGSTTQKTLTALNKGSSSELLFEISVDPEAEPGVYKIPLTINYDDAFENSYTIDTLTGIKVSTLPEIQIGIEKNEVMQALSAGNVVVKLSNTGLADLKFLTLKLQPSEDYNIMSNPQVYIGNLESDDYETAEFKILAKSREELNLKLLLTYRDAFNSEHESEEFVNVASYGGLSVMQLVLKQGGGLFKLVFYIALIAFIYIAFKEWRKTKHLPKALKIALVAVLIGIKRVVKAIRPRTLFRGIKAIFRFMREP